MSINSSCIIYSLSWLSTTNQASFHTIIRSVHVVLLYLEIAPNIWSPLPQLARTAWLSFYQIKHMYICKDFTLGDALPEKRITIIRIREILNSCLPYIKQLISAYHTKGLHDDILLGHPDKMLLHDNQYFVSCMQVYTSSIWMHFVDFVVINPLHSSTGSIFCTHQFVPIYTDF